MDEHNELSQKEELEALTSIYGDDWQTIDKSSRIYRICLQKEYMESFMQIILTVLLPPTYPRDGPPEFQLNATCFSDDEQTEMSNALDTIYKESAAEVVLFQWVEKLRECLTWKIEKETSIIQRRNYVANGNSSYNAISTQQSSGSDSDSDSKIGEDCASSSIVNNSVDIEIFHGEAVVYLKSTFQAHLALVKSVSQVAHVKEKLSQNRKVAHATHNVLAYRILDEERGTVTQDYDDDGEKAAGSRLLHLLEHCAVENVVVIVSRWYGGVLLGADRFKHYNNCALTLIGNVGLTKVDECSKGITDSCKDHGRARTVTV